MTKVSTLAIVGEEPAEVFRQLWGQEVSMKFKATRSAEDAAKTEPGEPSAKTDEDDWVDAEDEQGLGRSSAALYHGPRTQQGRHFRDGPLSTRGA